MSERTKNLILLLIIPVCIEILYGNIFALFYNVYRTVADHSVRHYSTFLLLYAEQIISAFIVFLALGIFVRIPKYTAVIAPLLFSLYTHFNHLRYMFSRQLSHMILYAASLGMMTAAAYLAIRLADSIKRKKAYPQNDSE